METNQHLYLGQEFLLWLFMKTAEDTIFDLSEQNEQNVVFIFEEQIVLDSVKGGDFYQTIKTANIMDCEEVMTAIKEGCYIAQARAKIIRNEAEWAFQIKTAPLSVKSVKLPIFSGEGEEGTIFGRTASIEMLQRILEALFTKFLIERKTLDLASEMKSFFNIG